MDILESLIARPGQTQEARLPAGLVPHFVDVEERSAAELFAYVKKLAAQVNFFDVNAGAVGAAGDWTPFFDASLPGDRDGGTAPHLALFAAFLKLYRIPRCAMNGITARHLDFFYRRVLGFEPRAPQPDRAHLLIELKKGAPPVAIKSEHAFSAGKDAMGIERVYMPLAETVINQAKVEKLLSVFFDPADGGTVCFAPIANSADGLGPAFKNDEPWRSLGYPGLPAAPIGFALASPVLRMAEGRRTVKLRLELDGLGPALTASEFERRLECFVTGETRWLGPYTVDAALSGGALILAFTVLPDEEGIADYDAAMHGHAFAASAPVVQVLLKVEDGKPQGYRDLLPVVVHSASVAVEVAGVGSLQLVSDAGPLDPKRAFMPFGAQPVPGSRFMVGCPEALSKNLSELTLELAWLGLPADFATLYTGYRNPPSESSFTVRAAMRDAAGRETSASTHYPLFQPREVGKVTLTLFGAGEPAAGTGVRVEALPARRIRAFAAGSGASLMLAARRERLKMPVYGFGASAAPAARPGFITFTLDRDFGHTEYRSKLLAGTPLTNEPYTPALSALSLTYRASSGEVPVDSDEDADFANADVEFFHVGCFGQRREHGWLRAQFAFVDDKRVPLFPAYEDEGELLVGLSALAAGDSVSLLFKVAEGSADPDVDPQPAVRWAVLCDNYWKPLAGGDAVRDGTNNLLATGLVAATLPDEATTQNSLLPAGLLWLKASVQKDVGGVCALVSVSANAIEVKRGSGGAPAARLWSPLPKGSIARLKTPVAAVKGVAQPFASFGGTTLESGEALNTRAAERLRHRNRAITAWDYERSVLAAFPEVRKVKVIPHCAGTGGWLDPGHVTIVVVPDLRLRNAVDPLQPRADADTLSRIREHLEDRSSMGTGVHVKKRSPVKIVVHARNPRYQRIRLDFKVRFRAGVEFNYHARQLREALIGHLSPWKYDPGAAIAFGGTVYKSQLIDFVEDTEYVDYVTDFRMYNLRGGPGDSDDVNEARAETPDTILVSDATHDIAPVPDSGTPS